MASPEVKLFFGGRNWNSELKQATKLPLLRALDSALDGIEFFELETPPKPTHGFVHKVSPTNKLLDRASTQNSKDFKLFLDNDENNLISARQVKEISATIVHELVHCRRMRRFRLGKGFFEAAATEGLANCAENIYIDEFCKRQIAKSFHPSSQSRNEALETDFIDAAYRYKQSSSDYLYKKWFYTSDERGLSRGALFGIQCVSEHIQDGYSISELIRLPAKEILGLE